jgi:hypothetical protein
MANDDVLTLARERFKRCVEFESENRKKQQDDIRFAAATPDDPWQWDERDRYARDQAGRPCLTINKLPQHIHQVTNDIRQNRPSIKYRAANDQAAPETAEILTGLSRHIESQSDADIAYDTALDHSVRHGLGYVRVLTDYEGEDSFDQEIFIRRVRDPFKVYLDPDCEDPAGSDARYAFIEESLSEQEFKEQYPDADPIDWDFPDHDWFTKETKTVRVAEYYTLESKDDELALWTNGATSFKSDGGMPAGVVAGEKPLKTRSMKRPYLCWRKITGDQELEKREYQWKYIPISRVLGNEAIVDGKHVVWGLVRGAKDAQRMYNVAQSAITERIMLAPRTPWVAPADAIEGYERYWESANTANHPYLPYNHIDTGNNPLPPPQRTAPATVETGLQQIMMAASDDIKATTGQYDASLGQRSNETSGKAIMARQREGDNATYHYGDNLARMVRHIGRIILDIIPTVYDTRRVARILGEDMSEGFAHVDPQMPQAYAETRDEQGAMVRIFNPAVGKYDIVITTGPSFTTRRMEAFDAMQQMTQANPQLWQVIGDQLVRNMDWPGADDMAERLKVTLLPEIRQMVEQEGKPQEIPPQVQMQLQQMQQMIQQLEGALQNAAAEAESKASDKAKVMIEAYKAETERMQVIAPAVPPDQVALIVQQTVQQMLQTPLQGAMPQ